MKKYLLVSIIAISLISIAAFASSQTDSETSGQNSPHQNVSNSQPPRGHGHVNATYANNLCTVTLPNNVIFTVNSINGKAPDSEVDCNKLLPPPPPGANNSSPPGNNNSPPPPAGPNSGGQGQMMNRPH